jgi:serine protease inhibitor
MQAFSLILTVLMVILSVLLFCCAGCIEEQPVNQTDYINIPLTEPISQADAVIVALSYPEVAKTIENDSFQIAVGKLSVSDVREGRLKEFHMVYIDRSNSTTHEPLESLQVIVTYDGNVYKIWRSFPPANSSISVE